MWNIFFAEDKILPVRKIPVPRDPAKNNFAVPVPRILFTSLLYWQINKFAQILHLEKYEKRLLV